MRKILLTLLVVLTLIVSIGCYEEPDWRVDIYVPYFESVTHSSPAHCVALWSNYHGPAHSEYIIEQDIGGGNSLSLIYSTEAAITNHTYSTGWVLNFPSSDAGQNEALSSVYASIDDDFPGIVPAFEEMYFLATGAEGDYEGFDQVAKRVRFHTQNWDNRWESVGTVKSWFWPISNSYRVIVGSQSYRDVGIMHYTQFIENGGTYLGAPKNYQPELSHSEF